VSGNRVSIVAGVLIAFIGTRFLEDGNLLVTSVITIFCATATRFTWELFKKLNKN
jgi:hypothetical protein